MQDITSFGYPDRLIIHMHHVLRSKGITFQELSHRGCETALDSLKAQGFSRKEVLTEFGHRGRDGALASLEAQGFTGEGAASTELGRRGGEARSAIYRIYRISGNCTYSGCTFAISSGEFCGKHNPPKPEKSDTCRVCERVLGVNEKRIVGGVCNPCYHKPEAVATRKKATAEKKATRGTCSTPGCNGINDRGRDKCYSCLYPRNPK